APLLLAAGILVARLLPSRWNCPPGGFCPFIPRDLTHPYRVLAAVLGAIAAAGVPPARPPASCLAGRDAFRTRRRTTSADLAGAPRARSLRGGCRFRGRLGLRSLQGALRRSHRALPGGLDAPRGARGLDGADPARRARHGHHL